MQCLTVALVLSINSVLDEDGTLHPDSLHCGVPVGPG